MVRLQFVTETWSRMLYPKKLLGLEAWGFGVRDGGRGKLKKKRQTTGYENDPPLGENER